MIKWGSYLSVIPHAGRNAHLVINPGGEAPDASPLGNFLAQIVCSRVSWVGTPSGHGWLVGNLLGYRAIILTQKVSS